MSKLEDFKTFVRDNPKLINYVKNDSMSWQKFYEMYDLYGSDNKVWDSYLKTDTKEENEEVKSSGIRSFNDIAKMAKNMDVDKIQEGITSLQKTISLFADLFVKPTGSTGSGYTPRPVYQNFED
mgnify:FL=1